MRKSLRSLLDELDCLQQPADLVELMDGLDACHIDRGELAPSLTFSDRGYTRNVLRTGNNYQALVLCWRPGQASPVHDHAGSSCAVKVITGQATETTYGLDASGHPYPTGRMVAGPGQILGSEDTDMHRVANRGVGDLITIHVYSPPLLRMNVWSDAEEVASAST